MKLLLIGKNGQLGSAIDKEAKDLGYDVLPLGHKDLDIVQFDSVRKKIEKFKPEVVINTAAYHVIPECEKNPEKAFLINTVAENNLALICQEKKIKLVYVSTDKVYDGKTKKPYTEKDKSNPIQVYGMSKLAGEIATLNYNPNSLIIRTCGIFGGVYGSRVKGGNFVLYLLRQAKIKKELEISSEQIASFAYTEDLARGILGLLDKKTTGIYNVVNRSYASWANFAQEIVRIRKLDFKIIPVDRHGSYGDIPTPIFTALNVSKATNIGIKLPHWKNALKRYLDFLDKKGL